MIHITKGESIILVLLGAFMALLTVILLLILCAGIILSFMKRKPFPKKLLIVTFSGVLLVFSIYLYGTYFFTFDSIDKEYTQKGLGPVLSPADRYTAHAYYEPYGGAAGGVNVWIEIMDHNNDEQKIIYYGDANTIVDIVWTDADTLFIKNEEPEYPSSNKSITLNVETDIYHDTGLACQSWRMKEEFETCYQE